MRGGGSPRDLRSGGYDDTNVQTLECSEGRKKEK
jgi:hypothetical protein